MAARRLLNPQRGSLVIMALLVSVALLVLGLGLLGSQAAKYEAANKTREGYRAKALAMAGLEDVRVKLSKHVLFPPKRVDITDAISQVQNFFSYSEDVRNSAGDVVGHYTVVVDRSWQRERAGDSSGPAEDGKILTGIWAVTVTGKTGPRDARPIAERTFYVEFNAFNMEVVRFEDRAGL